MCSFFNLDQLSLLWYNLIRGKNMLNDKKSVEINYLFNNKLNKVLNSQKFKDYCDHQVKKYSKDLNRLGHMFKIIATCRFSGNKSINLTLPDPKLTRETIFNETIGFYTELDRLTDGKHNFVNKVKEQIKYVKFAKNRSSVSLQANDKFVAKLIQLSDEPIVNNRTTAAHEAWHAIDQRNYTPSPQNIGKGNEFLGEIGSIFIEKQASQYVKSINSHDKELCKKLDYINNISHKINDVDKARDAYLDYLILTSISGNSETDKNWAQNEIINNYKVLWGPNTLDRKLNQITNFINTPNSHIDLMYEGRYVVSNIINEGIDNSKLTLSEKIDRMVDLNNNLITINNVDKDNLQNDFDIVTNHFGISCIETLTQQYADAINNTPNIQFSNENIDSNSLKYDGK